MRRARSRERGSETVELVAALPLLGFCVLIALQGVTLAREKAEAEADARAAARQLAACGAPAILDYGAIDPNTGAGNYQVGGGDATTVTVTVTLGAVKVLPLPGSPTFTQLAPQARVSMRREC